MLYVHVCTGCVRTHAYGCMCLCTDVCVCIFFVVRADACVYGVTLTCVCVCVVCVALCCGASYRGDNQQHHPHNDNIPTTSTLSPLHC